MYCTVWHDNEGKDPGWFLNRIVVTDLKQNVQYQFIINSWLAVDQGDGQISRVIPVATAQELRAFEHVFFAQTSRDLTDSHLWFSVAGRPPRSSFTRVQRVCCCLAVLLSTMLANALFYQKAEQAPAGDEIDFGGFTISWTEVVIGIQSALIVFPLNLLVAYLFRKTKPAEVVKREKKTGRRGEMMTPVISLGLVGAPGLVDENRNSPLPKRDEDRDELLSQTGSRKSFVGALITGARKSSSK